MASPGLSRKSFGAESSLGTLQRPSKEVRMELELVDCAPRSEMITTGTPKVGIQKPSKTLAHSSGFVKEDT